MLYLADYKITALPRGLCQTIKIGAGVACCLCSCEPYYRLTKGTALPRGLWKTISVGLVACCPCPCDGPSWAGSLFGLAMMPLASCHSVSLHGEAHNTLVDCRPYQPGRGGQGHRAGCTLAHFQRPLLFTAEGGRCS